MSLNKNKQTNNNNNNNNNTNNNTNNNKLTKVDQTESFWGVSLLGYLSLSSSLQTLKLISEYCSLFLASLSETRGSEWYL